MAPFSWQALVLALMSGLSSWFELLLRRSTFMCTFLAQLHKFHHGHFEVHSFPRMNVLSGRAIEVQLRSFPLGMSFLNLEKVLLAVQWPPTNSCKDYLEKLSSLS